VSLTSTCVDVSPYSHAADTCKDYSVNKFNMSPQAQAYFLDSAVIGQFDPATFHYSSTPYAGNPASSVRSIPYGTVTSVPEFRQELGKLEKKQKDKEKQPQLSPEGQVAVLDAFYSEWDKANKSRDFLGNSPRIVKEYGGLGPIFFEFFGKELEDNSAALVKRLQTYELRKFVAEKDEINSAFDAREAKIDATYRNSFSEAKERHAADLRLAGQTAPTLLQAVTSLSGEASVGIPADAAFLYAEDTASDRHLSWKISLGKRPIGKLELTSDNAMNASALSTGLTARQSSFPSASSLSALDKDEYEVRYGSRLAKTWTEAVPADISISDRLSVVDSPVGFAFQQIGLSTTTYNTLRMTDNQIATRLFSEAIAPYLLKLPSALEGIGATDKFQAADILISCSKKDFLEPVRNFI
jgi:hypothetical protein